MNTDELVKQKVDADIARYKSRKPNMTQEQENMLRKEFTRIQIDLIADRKKSEKFNASLNKIANMLKNKQKSEEKQQKNEIFSSKKPTQYNISVEQEQAKDYYSLNDWKSLSQTLRNQKPKCELCGAKSQDVHHVFPFMHQSPELRKTVFLDKDNLLCLCEKCHYAIHHNKLLPEQKYKLERLKSSISQKYLDLGLILSWL